MAEWQTIVLLTLLAGMAMPAGALLAGVERLLPGWLDTEVRHWVMAFGGGALLSAVALVLVPEAVDDLPVAGVVVCFGGGGLAFMLLDRQLARSRTRASQLVAMLSDFVPEALSLGAAFAFDPGTAVLLAGLMALQNLPEGFNAYRELTEDHPSGGRKVVGAFAAMALLGPACGLAGYWWLGDQVRIVSALMLFGAGGILYIVLQDIAPNARLERHWAPGLGAVAGFLLGVVGHLMTGTP